MSGKIWKVTTTAGRQCAEEPALGANCTPVICKVVEYSDSNEKMMVDEL